MTTPSPVPGDAPLDPTRADAAKASVWEDFIDIFYAPSQVFERRRDGRFGLALFVLALLTGILFYLFYRNTTAIWDAQFERQTADVMRQNPQVTREAMEKGRSLAGIFGPIGAMVSTAVGALITGVVLWIVGKFFDAKEDLKPAIMVATYAQFPRLLFWIVGAVQGLLLGEDRLTSMYSVMLSPARFLDYDSASKVLLALLSRIDVFVLWATALLAIGLHVVGRIPKARAWIAAAIVWVLGTIPALLTASRM